MCMTDSLLSQCVRHFGVKVIYIHVVGNFMENCSLRNVTITQQYSVLLMRVISHVCTSHVEF